MRPSHSIPPRLRLELLAVAACLSGCATPVAVRCSAGEAAMVHDLLYFGTAMPGGTVGENDWTGFVAEVVTPRFRDGLTAWPASGQWRSADGTITTEATHVLSLVHAGTEPAESGVRAIVDAYRHRFEQESVLRVRGQACVSF